MLKTITPALSQSLSHIARTSSVACHSRYFSSDRTESDPELGLDDPRQSPLPDGSGDYSDLNVFTPKVLREEHDKFHAPKRRRQSPMLLNEHGEPYRPEYGEWLTRPNETVYVRDRRIWYKQMADVRRKYRDEYREKFRQRLAEYTRLADAHMYRLQLRKAQMRERRRLKNIRLGALNAANKATKARLRMESEKRKNIVDYDMRDQKRDVIREMIWEKPSQNWIVKENFHKLNLDFLEQTDEYPGMPKPGEYDTMQGLFRHSDLYFENRDVEHHQKYTALSKQPIPWYTQQDDTQTEYLKESAPWLVKGYKPHNEDSIEYEQKEGNLLPNYWYNIDWDEAYLARQEKGDMDVPPTFIRPELVDYELDPYEDFRILKKPQYWKLIKNAHEMTSQQIVDTLSEIFADLLPPPSDESDSELDEEVFREKFMAEMMPVALSAQQMKREKHFAHKKQWLLYKDFYDRIKHFRHMVWSSAKINFDSGLRRWRREVPKWRYMIFESKDEHLQWRDRLRNPTLSAEDIQLCRKAIIRLQQLEHLSLARRTGPPTIQKLIGELESDVMKVFYIWLEELSEKGEAIAMGAGWSYNRYDEDNLLPVKKAKQVPIEYFNLKLHNNIGFNAPKSH